MDNLRKMTSPLWKSLCMRLLNNKYARHTDLCVNSAIKCECGLSDLKKEIQKLYTKEMSEQERKEKGL